MQAVSQSYAFWIGLFLALGVLYFSPILIGAIRRVEKLWVLVGLNFIPLLWPAAIIGAFMLPRRRPPMAWPPPTQVFGQIHYPPPGSSEPW